MTHTPVFNFVLGVNPPTTILTGSWIGEVMQTYIVISDLGRAPGTSFLEVVSGDYGYNCVCVCLGSS